MSKRSGHKAAAYMRAMSANDADPALKRRIAELERALCQAAHDKQQLAYELQYRDVVIQNLRDRENQQAREIIDAIQEGKL